MYRQGIALFISLFWIPDWNPIVTQPNRLRQFKTSNDILPGDTTEIMVVQDLKVRPNYLVVPVPLLMDQP